MSSKDALLRVSGLNSAVEGFQVTSDVDFTVEESSAVGYVGRNGAGKTTTFRSVMGLADILAGSIQFNSEELTNLRPEQIPQRGIGYQPEDRKLFTGMTIDENFRMPIWTLGDKRGIEDEEAAVEEVYDIFKELSERREAKVENLSGGQAKMVSIGRALALKPDLLILDEPLEGLAPIIVERLKSYIQQINDRGIAVLIAESNMQHVSDMVDKLYVIERGEIFEHGDPNEVSQKREVQELMQGSGNK